MHRISPGEANVFAEKSSEKSLTKLCCALLRKRVREFDLALAERCMPAG